VLRIILIVDSVSSFDNDGSGAKLRTRSPGRIPTMRSRQRLSRFPRGRVSGEGAASATPSAASSVVATVAPGTPVPAVAPLSDDEALLKALVGWCQVENNEFLTARAGAHAAYMQAISNEVDVMTAYVLARSSGAPQDEVREIRELLVRVTAEREAAARKLGRPGVLPDAARACIDLLTAGAFAAGPA
jgi:hypothetical protein